MIICKCRNKHQTLTELAHSENNNVRGRRQWAESKEKMEKEDAEKESEAVGIAALAKMENLEKP